MIFLYDIHGVLLSHKVESGKLSIKSTMGIF